MNGSEARLDRNELLLITRQFGGMLDAGIDVLRILEVLREQFGNPLAKEIFTSVEKDMRLGRLLSTALGRYPEVFSPFYVSIIRQGELDGSLPQAFGKLAEHLSRPIGAQDVGEHAAGAHGVTALVDRITPIAFWLALSSAATVIAIAALWYATNAGHFARESLGPNVLLLVGILILLSSLVFARLRPRHWVMCAFCGRSQQIVAYMRRSANGAICDACIESSYLAWQAERPREAPRATETPAEGPKADAVEPKQRLEPHVIEEEEEEIIGDEFQVVQEKEEYY